MKYFRSLLLFLSVAPFIINAQTIEFSLKASGNVIDVVITDDLLYAATDNGSVDVFNIKERKIIRRIKVPGLKDFMGDDIQAKVFSVDVSEDGKKVILVYQGKGGFRNVAIYENNELRKIIDADTDKMMIKKAKLINNSHLLIGQLSNEIVLFNIENRTVIYKKQISTSSFSDFVLSKDKSKFITTDESGKVRLIASGDGKLIKEYSGNNVDNIYKLDYKNDIIIGGGQDRRVAIYNTQIDDRYYIQNDFLVYCVGLSPDGQLGAYSANEDNDVVIFNTLNKTDLFTLKGQVSTLTGICFISNE
ncbi:MAG: hypothetical protein B6D61_09255, partial [Bacteroidetes bacterium 4484_249]